MNEEEIKSKLIKDIGIKRFMHSKRVVQTALILNTKLELKIDEKKIKLAGILHDCAKYNEDYYYKKYINKFPKLEKYKDSSSVFHAFLGPIVAKEEYDIEDKDILNAIKYHTTGNENMTDFEKLIFISDAIEPSRNYEGVDILRKFSNENLDKAVLESLDQTIKFLIEKKKDIYLLTIKARNSILKGNKWKN
ncbi:MAG: bis(5'-nucleosyl)-tetraphosphatase (symmetrical) YqeK [Peptoniphilaceae bacterium]|nr:bis(5'-nucleosyl)-tetraphosphatase (symmetrical) YqeK [Peptoniphilaceae bacterium]MDD7383478.1 bis(5'-nucleosyl)-tetraphosphatase (symmetrical) YqeK [Peptoniphilaceae bacterium]MDY3738460.1 bis(5'-nucleosyl)-tetraphosphatase (symmetrical) YqeK [Peptoniphilaceae bacterium]